MSSTDLEDARQQLIDERLPDLEGLTSHRIELLREMFRLVHNGEGSSTSVYLEEEEEEDAQDEELERFLERFDLRKNLQTGSIMTLDIPELMLKAGPSREATPAGQEEEAIIELPPESDDVKLSVGDSDDLQLQYPMVSPPVSRTQRRKTDEEETKGGLEDIAMDVDEPAETAELPAPSVQDAQEDDIVDIEEDDTHEQEVEPQTPPMSQTVPSAPSTPRKRKRPTSHLSDDDDDELVKDYGRSRRASRESRRTHSKSRKTATPPPVGAADDEERDELDIISASSASNISPPRRRAARRLSAAMLETVSAREDEGGIEQADEHEQRELSEPAENAEQPSTEEMTFVPASPSTPSVRSLSKSPQVQPPPSSATHEGRESPIRAPRPKGPQIIDNTPLTPPRSPPPPIIIELPVHQPGTPVYRFVEGPTAHAPAEPEVKTEGEATLPPERAQERERAVIPVETKTVKKLALEYSLPPLSALPAEFNRKSKPQKSRKRDKERERSGSDNGKKDDWVPLGIAKWASLVYTNPAYKKLGRATKCVSTKDWNTASTELKLIRTLDRIDVLKRTGKWSFRQLKKQRVAAGLVKTHWDYLMDEMKWMQVDFREERRWKIALAYELALCVREWHEAGSQEERVRLGICALWKKPAPLEELPAEEQQHMEVDIIPAPESDEDEDEAPPMQDPRMRRGLVEFTSSDNEDDDVEDQRAVTAALIPDPTAADALNDSQQPFFVPDASEVPSIAMKLEEVEDAAALHLVESADPDEQREPFLQLPRDIGNLWEDVPKTEAIYSSQLLKDISNDPTLDSQPTGSLSVPEPAQKERKSPWTPEQAKLLRNSLLLLPEETLAISMDQFVPMSDGELAKSLFPEGASSDAALDFDLTAIFPELQPFSLIDVPNSDIVGGNSDSRKKGDKKADKDDPTKRAEETTYTKLCPTNRFMHVKPTLVSALQPAKKWRKGKWVDLDESPVVSDVDSPPSVPSPENNCSLFEGRRITIPFQPPLMLHNFSKLPRSTVKAAEIPWSQAEDNMLKNLAERYPSNWRLVADALNSSRIRTSIDLRTPQECFERWRVKCGVPTRPLPPSSMQATTAPFINNEDGTAAYPLSVMDPPPPTPSVPTSTPQMTTRGIKRLATSAAQNAVNLTVNTGVPTVETRKRKRHFIIYEAVRKTLAKRQKQRKQDEMKYQTSSAVAPVHDTHHQFGAKVRYTPIELSQMKAERDRKEYEMQLMRRRELDVKRQQQQQQLQAQLQQQVQQQQQQQQQQMGQQGVALPQNVPQIRTQVGISQHSQQKLPTQAGSAPLSPLQMMQQAQAAQQARALAQAQAQSQAQQPQAQPNLTQMQGQLASTQPNMNGTVPHISVPYVNHGGASSPVATQSSPPRTGATPVNSVATFPRPSSAQRNVTMPGSQVLPMASGSVPIARTNNALASYFASNGAQYTPEQLSHLMRYQAVSRNSLPIRTDTSTEMFGENVQQQQLLQQQQAQQAQQQQPVQMQMQQGQQNAHQGNMTGGYSSLGQ